MKVVLITSPFLSVQVASPPDNCDKSRFTQYSSTCVRSPNTFDEAVDRPLPAIQDPGPVGQWSDGCGAPGPIGASLTNSCVIVNACSVYDVDPALKSDRPTSSGPTHPVAIAAINAMTLWQVSVSLISKNGQMTNACDGSLNADEFTIWRLAGAGPFRPFMAVNSQSPAVKRCWYRKQLLTSLNYHKPWSQAFAKSGLSCG